MSDYAGKLAIERNEWIEEASKLRARVAELESALKMSLSACADDGIDPLGRIESIAYGTLHGSDSVCTPPGLHAKVVALADELPFEVSPQTFAKVADALDAAQAADAHRTSEARTYLTPVGKKCAKHNTFPDHDEPCWGCEREAMEQRTKEAKACTHEAIRTKNGEDSCADCGIPMVDDENGDSVPRTNDACVVKPGADLCGLCDRGTEGCTIFHDTPRPDSPCTHPLNEVTNHGLSSGGRMMSWCAACGSRRFWQSDRIQESAWEAPSRQRPEPAKVDKAEDYYKSRFESSEREKWARGRTLYEVHDLAMAGDLEAIKRLVAHVPGHFEPRSGSDASKTSQACARELWDREKGGTDASFIAAMARAFDEAIGHGIELGASSPCGHEERTETALNPDKFADFCGENVHRELAALRKVAEAARRWFDDTIDLRKDLSDSGATVSDNVKTLLDALMALPTGSGDT
jgi:hypothetical protein